MHDLILCSSVIGVFSISTGVVLKCRRRSLLCCQSCFAAMYRNQLSGADDYVGQDDEPDPEVDAIEMYRATGGLLGIHHRWHNRRPLMCLAQIRSQLSGLTPGEMAYVSSRAELLTQASVEAALWGLVRYAFPHRSALAGQKALRLYKEMAYMVRNVYHDQPNNFCGAQLSALL